MQSNAAKKTKVTEGKKSKAKVFSIGNVAQDMAKNIMERVEGVEAKANFDLREIPLEEIAYHPENKYGMRDLEKLAESLKEKGQQHNAVVRPYTDPENPEIKYQLISGERRHRALAMIGAKTIFTKAEDMDDTTALELLDVINLQTRELTEMERAEAVERLFKLVEDRRGQGIDYGGKKTRDVVADIISNDTGKINPATVAQLKKLNELIPEFKTLVRELGYQYAQLPEEQQKLIYYAFAQGKELTAKEAKGLKEELLKKDADHQQVVDDYKNKIRLKEEEAQDFKKEAEETAIKLKAITKEKADAEKELNETKQLLNTLQDEREINESKANEDIEALRTQLKAEAEKEAEEQSATKIKELTDALARMEQQQAEDIRVYKEKADQLKKELDEKAELLKAKQIEKNLTEGNKAIQSLARQAQKALCVLIDEIAVYVGLEGFELTEETKTALAEIRKHEGEINKNR